MVMGEQTREDRGARWTTERRRHEARAKFATASEHKSTRLRHLAERSRTLVVGYDHEDVWGGESARRSKRELERDGEGGKTCRPNGCIRVLGSGFSSCGSQLRNLVSSMILRLPKSVEPRWAPGFGNDRRYTVRGEDKSVTSRSLPSRLSLALGRGLRRSSRGARYAKIGPVGLHRLRRRNPREVLVTDRTKKLNPSAPVAEPEQRFPNHIEQRTIVLTEQRVLYLPVPKSGWTTIGWLLAELAGLRSELFEHSILPGVSTSLTIHDMRLWGPGHRLGDYERKERERILSEDGWFRFSVVRDPAPRLWSGWQSKLLLREPRFFEMFGQEPWFPRIPERPEDLVDDFRRFAAAVSAGEAEDVHWAIQSELVDHLPIDHVGRLEKLDEFSRSSESMSAARTGQRRRGRRTAHRFHSRPKPTMKRPQRHLTAISRRISSASGTSGSRPTRMRAEWSNGASVSLRFCPS